MTLTMEDASDPLKDRDGWVVRVATDYGVWTMQEESDMDPCLLDRYVDVHDVELHEPGGDDRIGRVSVYIVDLERLLDVEDWLLILDEDGFTDELVPILVGPDGKIRPHAKRHETLARFSNLEIAPAYRGHKAGRILLEAARRVVPQQSMMAVIARPIPGQESSMSEEALVAWYSRLGFRHDAYSGFMITVNDLSLPPWFPEET